MVSKDFEGHEYSQWLSDLKAKIRNSQLTSALKVNAEMLALYWELGKNIANKLENSQWGEKVIAQLSADLIAEFNDIQGFSPTNLKYIRRWYQFYSTIGQHAVDQFEELSASAETPIPIGQHAVDQLQSSNQFPPELGLIPWGHHIQIFTKSESIDEALFYMQQTVAYNWKRTILIYHIESGLYKRKGKALTNFKMTLPNPQSELAGEVLKNPYSFGFLNLSENSKEKELETAILSNIERVLLELGAGFALYGRQYHLQIGNKDYYIDLLFYHTNLNCFVVIELKVKEFIPEYAGKLEFYITAIDEQLKKMEHNQTIGILICKTIDQITVEYTLKTKTKPIGVATYSNKIPTELKDYLPDVETLKHELEKKIVIPFHPIDEKINKLKHFVSKLGNEGKLVESNNKILKQLFNKIVLLLRKIIEKKISIVKGLFNNSKILLIINNTIINENIYKIDINSILASEKNLWMSGFEFSFQGLKNAGARAFDISHRFEIKFEKYRYLIGQEMGSWWDERPYSKIHTKEELEIFADRFIEMIVDDITKRLEQIYI